VVVVEVVVVVGDVAVMTSSQSSLSWCLLSTVPVDATKDA